MKHLLFSLCLLLVSSGFDREALAAPPPLEAVKDRCKDSLDVAIFTSPRRPSKKEGLRILIVSERDLSDAEFVAYGPKGTVVPLQA